MTVALERLLGQGEIYVDPLSVIVWEQADVRRHWLPRHLLSVGDLPEQLERKLSHIDFCRLAMASLWIEGLLIHKVSAGGFLLGDWRQARLALKGVREDAGHALMFLQMVDLAGLQDVPLLGPTATLDRVAARLDPDNAAFWALAFLGESVADSLALRAINEDDGICPVARQVLQLHHREETLHLAAARALLAERLPRMGAARRRAFAAALPAILRRFLRAALFPTAESLEALGLPNPAQAAAAVWREPRRRAFAADCARAAVGHLRRAGLPLPARESYPW